MQFWNRDTRANTYLLTYSMTAIRNAAVCDTASADGGMQIILPRQVASYSVLSDAEPTLKVTFVISDICAVTCAYLPRLFRKTASQLSRPNTASLLNIFRYSAVYELRRL